MRPIAGRCSCGRTTGQQCAICRKLVCRDDCAIKVRLDHRQARVHVRCARKRGLAQPEPPEASKQAIASRKYYKAHKERVKARVLARYYELKATA
jgi:hypothetical protein